MSEFLKVRVVSEGGEVAQRMISKRTFSSFKHRPSVLLLCALMLSPLVSITSLLAYPNRTETGEVTVYGEIWNDTLDRHQSVDRVSLLLPQKMNQLIQTIEHAGPKFSFDPIPMPAGPMLLRVEYGRESYEVLIPPSRSSAMEKQKIRVYESGAKLSDIQVTSMVQAIKRKSSLQISEIYSVNNSSYPRMVFDSDSFFLPIPSEATALRVFLQSENSGVPVPVTLEKREGGYHFPRGVMPGLSGITIEYEVSGHSVSIAPFTIGEGAGAIRGTTRILLWQPASPEPEIEGAAVKALKIPELGDALQLQLSGSTPARIDMERGGYVVSDPVESVANPVFDSPSKTFLALALLLALFLFVLPRAAARLDFLNKK